MPSPPVLALIPARGGSKGIPGKNIKPLGEHPLIAYSIAAGLAADGVTRVIVSTDDDSIAEVARTYGAETPFMRPAEFAQDETTDLPVFRHALGWLAENEGYRPKVVVQLRPTSPFRPPGLVDQALAVLVENPQASSVRGVVPSGQNPYKMWRLAESGALEPLLDSPFEEPYNMPRQALPPTYWQTGHIDAVRPAVIEDGSMSGERIFPVHIDPRYLVDLDNLLDWERAEWRLKDPSLDIVHPEGRRPRARRLFPGQVDLVVFDFDGVFTDNTAFVDQDGVESVRVHRGDGMGIELLREAGVDMFVLSTEPNPVVAARCRKLKLPYLHGVGRKGEALAGILAERGADPSRTIYVGNDVNDLPCFPLVGCALVVTDAHPAALAQADLVLARRGGDGAVREVCDRILAGRASAGE